MKFFLNSIDIVYPDSKRCCCFTKSYYRYVKGTGSLLATVQVSCLCEPLPYKSECLSFYACRCMSLLLSEEIMQLYTIYLLHSLLVGLICIGSLVRQVGPFLVYPQPTCEIYGYPTLCMWFVCLSLEVDFYCTIKLKILSFLVWTI